MQTYRGRRALTWWQGTGLGGLASGTDYIYNDHYQPIATVNAGNGLTARRPEFLITRRNTALILAYTTANADLTSIGGPPNQTVINGVVQEIDIALARSYSSGTARPRPVQPERAAAAILAEHAVGLVPHQRGAPRHRRQPADRRTEHLDDVQGQPAHQRRHLAARRQEQQLHAAAAPGQDSTTPASCSPGSTTQKRSGTACTRSSTTSLGHPVASLQPGDHRQARRAPVATLVRPTTSRRALRLSQGNAQAPATAACSSAGASLPYFSQFHRIRPTDLQRQFPAGVNTYRAYRLPWGDGHAGHGRRAG